MDISKIMPLILTMAIPFSLASADTTVPAVSIQEQVLQQINSLLHAKPNISLELDKKMVPEYSLIGAIALVVIIVVSSSARSKSKAAHK